MRILKFSNKIKHIIFTINIVFILSLCSLFILDINASEDVKFIKEINSELVNPVDVALSNLGDIYVLDSKSSKVYIFDSKYKLKNKFGVRGKKDGQLMKPRSLAISRDGLIFVADTGNNRIQVFDEKGKFSYNFGAIGFKNGEFKFPYAIAIDKFGFVYVADKDNKRVQVFTERGVYLFSINDLEGKPIDLDLDQARNLYVMVPQKKQIIKYSPHGVKLKALKVRSNNYDYVSNATGIGVDSVGDIYIAEVKEQSIKKIDMNGKLLASFGSEGDGRGQFYNPAGIACSPSGHIYVADSMNKRLQVLEIKGSNKQKLSSSSKSRPTIEWVSTINAQKNIIDLIITKERELYALSDLSGNIINLNNNQTFGGKGIKTGKFKKPSALYMAASGKICVADTMNNRVQIFNTNTTFNYHFGQKGFKNGQFNQPSGIAVNKNGNIYISDTLNHRVQIFNDDCIFLSSFGGKSITNSKSMPKNGSFLGPKAIAISPEGHIYVVDSGNNRIQIFNKSGTFIKKIDAFKPTDSMVSSQIKDIVIDVNGFLYIAYQGSNNIDIFDIYEGESNFILSFGSSGQGHGSFSKLSAVTAADSKIYAADYNSDQIQIFQFYPGGVSIEDEPFIAKKENKSVVPSTKKIKTKNERLFITKINSTGDKAIQDAIIDLMNIYGVPIDKIESSLKIENEKTNPNGLVQVTVSVPNIFVKKNKS